MYFVRWTFLPLLLHRLLITTAANAFLIWEKLIHTENLPDQVSNLDTVNMRMDVTAILTGSACLTALARYLSGNCKETISSHILYRKFQLSRKINRKLNQRTWRVSYHTSLCEKESPYPRDYRDNLCWIAALLCIRLRLDNSILELQNFYGFTFILEVRLFKMNIIWLVQHHALKRVACRL